MCDVCDSYFRPVSNEKPVEHTVEVPRRLLGSVMNTLNAYADYSPTARELYDQLWHIYFKEDLDD